MAGSKKKRQGTPRPNNGGHKPQGDFTKDLDKAIRSYCRKENKSYDDVIKKGSGYCYKDMLPRHLRRKAKNKDVSNSMRSIRNKANENNTTKMNNNKNNKKNKAKGTQTKQTIPNDTKVSKIFNDPDNNNKPRPYSGVVKSFDEEKEVYRVDYAEDNDAEELTEEEVRAIIVKPKRKSSGGNNKQSSTTTARKKRKTTQKQSSTSTSTSSTSTSTTRTKRSEVTPTNNGSASDTTSKRTTRNSTGLTRSSAESLDENSDEDSDNHEPKGRDKQQPPTSPTTIKDKEGDENDTTALNKGDAILDTDMEKEEEKDDDSAPLEWESGGATHDENIFDEQQSPIQGGGSSSMQSPAKSVSSSDVVNHNAIVVSTLAPFAKEVQREADEIGEEITELYEQRIVAPLEQQITTIKRRIEKRETILENAKNKDTDDLEDCYKPNIAECELDLESKRKELAEKELELESIRGGNIHKAVLAKCISAAQAQLSVRDVSGINLLAPSMDTDVNATTGSTSNIDTQKVDSITTQLMPEVTNRCKSFINTHTPGLIKKLDATKSKALKEMKSLFYDKSVLPLKKKRDRLTYAYNIKVTAFNSIVEGVKDYPGSSEEEYWEMVSEERALLDKKTDELKKEVDEARSIYYTAKEIWIDEVKKQDAVFKKTFTIMIGSIKIEPSQENDDDEEDDDTEK